MKSGPIAKRGVARVDISLAARGDLEAIDNYGLDHFGEGAADRVQEGIREAFVMLSQFPLSAPERPEYGAAIRCKMHRGYRILYRIAETGVFIVRVVHHSRSISDLTEL
jgi:plasmid stabilization system protein ParE